MEFQIAVVLNSIQQPCSIILSKGVGGTIKSGLAKTGENQTNDSEDISYNDDENNNDDIVNTTTTTTNSRDGQQFASLRRLCCGLPRPLDQQHEG